jgi:hypothetical protein
MRVDASGQWGQDATARLDAWSAAAPGSALQATAQATAQATGTFCFRFRFRHLHSAMSCINREKIDFHLSLHIDARTNSSNSQRNDPGRRPATRQCTAPLSCLGVYPFKAFSVPQIAPIQLAYWLGARPWSTPARAAGRPVLNRIDASFSYPRLFVLLRSCAASLLHLRFQTLINHILHPPLTAKMTEEWHAQGSDCCRPMDACEW